MPREWTTDEQKAELERHTDDFLQARQEGGIALEKFIDARYSWLVTNYTIDSIGFNDPEINQGTPEEVQLKKKAALKSVSQTIIVRQRTHHFF